MRKDLLCKPFRLSKKELDMKTFTVTKNDADQRLDKYLMKMLKTMPKSLVYKSLRKKRIKINGKRVTDGGFMLREGNILECYINDEFFEQKDSTKEFLLLTSAVLEIVYEDENILVANKPVGLSVHTDESGSPDTLINRIQKYLYNKGEYDPEKDCTFAPSLAHRIDRNTCGLVLAAKNAEALRTLCEKIKQKEIKKYYLCIVCGHLPKEHDTLKAYHKKDEAAKQADIFDRPVPGAKEIITKYKVLRRYQNHDLAEVQLVTGRTHQIRAHMAHIGHPLLGDGKYSRPNKSPAQPHQALMAYKLRFDFQTEAGILSYLNGKEVTVKKTKLCESDIEKKL